MMKRYVCALLAAVMLLATALAEGGASEAVPADVLAYVDGEPVSADDAQLDFDLYYAQYEYYAQMYGWTDWEPALKRDIAERYVRIYLQLREAERLGLAPLSEEEEAELTVEADAMYDNTVASYTEYFMTDDLTAEEAGQIVVEWLEDQGFSRDYLRKSVRENEILSRYRDYVTADVTVTDEEALQHYQTAVDGQRESYDAYPALFVQEAQDGETAIYYYPEGVRSIFHILFLYSDEEKQAVTTLNDELDAARRELDAGEGDPDALNARVADLQAQLDEALSGLYARAQAVYDRLEAGEDFHALMDELGEDPGMRSEPYRSSGYYTYAGNGSFVQEFQDGAMALENPGDVSGPVLTSYGLHIILFDRELESGAVPYDEVKDEITRALLDTRADEVYGRAVDALYESADIEYHTENLVHGAPDGDSEEQGWG